MCGNEDEERIVHACDGVFDQPTNLAWIEVSEVRDFSGGLAFVVHGVDEVAFSFREEVCSGEDMLSERVRASLSEIDGG